MKRFLAMLLISSTALFCSDQVKRPPKPQPFSSDQIAVYHAFFAEYSKGSHWKELNVSQHTEPFDAEDALTRVTTDAKCLKDLSFEKLSSIQTHRFSRELDDLKHIHLVDPVRQRIAFKRNDPSRMTHKDGDIGDAVSTAFVSGLLTLTEVIFSKDGKYAVMSFRFFCGGLCGHGGTLIFEKHDSGEWKQTNRECSGWIS